MQHLINRLLGALSLIVALFCLYLALTLLAEKLLSHKLKEKLQAANIDSETAIFQWSGKGLCAYQLRISSPQYQLQSEIQSLCAELNYTTTWPFVDLSHISVNGAQVWLKLPSVKLSSRQGSQSDSQGKTRLWSKIESSFKRTLSLSQHLREIHQYVQTGLAKLKHYDLSLHDAVLRIQNAQSSLKKSSYKQASLQKPIVIGLGAQLNKNGGTVSFHSAFSQGITQLLLSSEQVQLQSKFVLNWSGIDQQVQKKSSKLSQVSFSKGSKILFKDHEVFINGKLKPNFKNDQYGASLSILSFKLHSNLATKLIKLSTQFHTGTRPSQNFLQVWGQLQIHSLKVLNLKWNDLNFDSESLKNKGLIPTSLISLFDSLKFDSACSGDLKLYPNYAQVNSQFTKVNLELPTLPHLTWPQFSVKGELKSPWSVGEFQEWGFKNLSLSVQGKQAQKVQAYLSLLTKYNPSAHNFSQKLKDLDLDLRAPKTSCQNLYDLIPISLLGPIKKASLTGYASPQVNLIAQSSADGETPKLKLKIKNLLRRCRFEHMNIRPPTQRVTYKNNKTQRTEGVEWLNDQFTFIIDPQLSNGKTIKVGPGSKGFVPYKELPRYVGGAMYLTEETGFWRGGAFSLPLLNRALNTNLREGRFVYGGSTITQQLVKNLFLGRQKTLTRKIREALISARIIDHVSKQRVLELYLNMIEFGPAIFGIQAAAKYYFQKDARNLSPEEAIFLAMLKVSPKRGKSWKRRGYSPKFTWWKSRMVEIFKRLTKEGLVTESRAKDAAPFILKWDNGRYIGSERLSKTP